MRRWPSWLITAAALGATCWPQVISGLSPQNQASQNVAKFTVSGIVVNSVTGEPIRRALVRANDSAAMSDAEGRFEIQGVPAGYTRLMPSKPGYFSEEELNPYTSVAMLQVGAATGSVTVKLTPAAVITGVVRDGKGEPMEGVVVEAIYERIVDGRKRRESRGNAQSAEDGAFRIARLLPGTYYLLAARERYRRFTAGIDRLIGPAPTYFPDSPDRDSATALHLQPGQQATADFELHETPLFNVRGRVNGIPATGGFNLQVVDSSGQPASAQPQLDSSSASFDIESLSPGKYRLQGTGQDGNNHLLYGETPINLQRDLQDVQVSLAPLPTIPIEVREISTGEHKSVTILGPPEHQQRLDYFLRATLRSLDAQAGPDHEAEMDQSASSPTWLLRNVQPGAYSVEVNVNSPWYVDSVTCAGKDLLRDALTVTSSSHDPIEVTLRDDAATLSGELKWQGAAAIANVLIVPDSQPANVRVLPNITSGFSTGGLPPGEYSILALTNSTDLEYRNPDVIRPFLSQATHATLNANQVTKVQMAVAGDVP